LPDVNFIVSLPVLHPSPLTGKEISAVTFCSVCRCFTSRNTSINKIVYDQSVRLREVDKHQSCLRLAKRISLDLTHLSVISVCCSGRLSNIRKLPNLSLNALRAKLFL